MNPNKGGMAISKRVGYDIEGFWSVLALCLGGCFHTLRIMSRKKKKDRKKKDGTDAGAPDAVPPEAEATPPPASRRRRIVVGAAAALLLLATGFAIWASTLPGYRPPNEDLVETQKRLQFLSTALYRWARQHDGLYPASLRVLREEGLLPEATFFETGPVSGDPFVLEAGIRTDMPPSTVLLAPPPDAALRFVPRSPGRRPLWIAPCIGADGSVQFEAAREGASPEDAKAAAAGKMASRLQRQREVFALLRKSARGSAGARKALAGRLASPAHPPPVRALAAWGMGVSGDPSFGSALVSAFRSAGGVPNELGIAVSLALLRLGDLRGVSKLIDALEEDETVRNRAIEGALRQALGGGDDPPPAYRPYAPDAERARDVARLRAWWKARRSG